MTAKELQIGDWVLQDGFEYQVVMLRKCDIRNEYPIALDSIVHGYTYCPEDAIEPVPLTPEILEKNGWVTDGHTWWRNDEGFSISGEYYRRKSGEPLYISITGEATCDLNYVHTLQHALRLCGLHDLADNFKI